jgi:hypothetical protein
VTGSEGGKKASESSSRSSIGWPPSRLPPLLPSSPPPLPPYRRPESAKARLAPEQHAGQEGDVDGSKPGAPFSGGREEGGRKEGGEAGWVGRRGGALGKMRFGKPKRENALRTPHLTGLVAGFPALLPSRLPSFPPFLPPSLTSTSRSATR